MLKIHVINPFDTRRLKHPNYNITQWFDSQKINYVHDENDPDWIIIHVFVVTAMIVFLPKTTYKYYRCSRSHSYNGVVNLSV